MQRIMVCIVLLVVGALGCATTRQNTPDTADGSSASEPQGRVVKRRLRPRVIEVPEEATVAEETEARALDQEHLINPNEQLPLDPEEVMQQEKLQPAPESFGVEDGEEEEEEGEETGEEVSPVDDPDTDSDSI